MTSSREDLVKLGKLWEQAERYDDMAKCMSDVVKTGAMLSSDERNLLSVAYKNVVGSLRSSYRIISSIEHKHQETGEDNSLIKEAKKKIELELNERCNEVFKLLDDFLLPQLDGVEHSEANVFFLKMKGDYYRYEVEIAPPGDKREELAGAAEKAYESANTIGIANLPNTHPIRLGLALNFSVFYFEIMNDAKRACELARGAFDHAIAELDSLKEESYKDSTLIMQLLRDNLTLWTSEGNQDEED